MLTIFKFDPFISQLYYYFAINHTPLTCGSLTLSAVATVTSAGMAAVVEAPRDLPEGDADAGEELTEGASPSSPQDQLSLSSALVAAPSRHSDNPR